MDSINNSERLARVEAQVESLKEDMSEVKADIKDIHSRITTGNREIMQKIDDKIDALAKADKDQHEQLKTTMDNVKERVDILEKWRWMIVGGSIVLGYLVAHLDFFVKIFN
jgi:predicted RNase H-like nuclease (RuvC/YqgF family)